MARSGQVVKHPDDPGVSAVLFGVGAASANDVWAVGEYQHPLDRFHTLIEHFDGTRWSIVPSPDPGATGDVLYSVRALGRSAAWAVGEEYDEGPVDRALILNWDGEKWTRLTAPADRRITTTAYLARGRRGRQSLCGRRSGRRFQAHRRAFGDGRGRGQPLVDRTQSAGGRERQSFLRHRRRCGRARNGRSAHGSIRRAAGSSRSPNARAPAKAAVISTARVLSHGGDSLLGGAVAVGHDVWAVGAYDGPKAQKSLILHTCR